MQRGAGGGGGGFGTNVNVAVTAWSALIDTVQVPVPAQPPPLQPVNLDPAAGVAVSVTDWACAPVGYVCEQVLGQAIEAPFEAPLATLPAPVPARMTVSTCAAPATEPV